MSSDSVAVCFFLTIIFYFILELVAIIDILRSEFTGSNKLIWFLAVIFLPVVGVIAYFAFGRKQKIVQVK